MGGCMITFIVPPNRYLDWIEYVDSVIEEYSQLHEAKYNIFDLKKIYDEITSNNYTSFKDFCIKNNITYNEIVENNTADYFYAVRTDLKKDKIVNYYELDKETRFTCCIFDENKKYNRFKDKDQALIFLKRVELEQYYYVTCNVRV